MKSAQQKLKMLGPEQVTYHRRQEMYEHFDTPAL